MTITSDNIAECPLGIFDCKASRFSDNSSQRARQNLIGCRNYSYCSSVTRAWDLPLLRIESELFHYWEVRLFYPNSENLDMNTYRKHMKQHGYAEARTIPFFNNHVEINVIRAGYAQPVNIRLILHNFLSKDFISENRDLLLGITVRNKQDDNGLWWNCYSKKELARVWNKL